MKKIRNIIISVILVLTGFVFGCIIQPAFRMIGPASVCFGCSGPTYTLDEVVYVNTQLEQQGLQNTYLVPYEHGRAYMVMYEFLPWKKKRAIEKIEALIELTPSLCECEEAENKNSNQQIEPIVTTPLDEVEAQSAQAHP